MNELPAIVLVAFGASSAAAREVYSRIETRVRAAFPQHEVVWAYLSRSIVARQRQQGVYLATPEEAYAGLAAKGFRRAIVQPLLIAPGEEYHNLKAMPPQGLELHHGTALLEGAHALSEALEAIAPHIAPRIPHVLVCHGNRKHAHFNTQLIALQQLAQQRFDNLLVASIEGQPGEAPLTEARRQAQLCGEVVFVPFMLVAGEHITSDVMGDEPDAWRHQVGAARSVCRPALGENPAIHQLFLRRIATALTRAEKESVCA